MESEDWRGFALFCLLVAFLLLVWIIIVAITPSVSPIIGNIAQSLPILIICSAFCIILVFYVMYYVMTKTEEFKKIVTEMGLEESKKGTHIQITRESYINSKITGNYRNHHIEIQEHVNYANADSGSIKVSRTNYNVELENPQTILMRIVNRNSRNFPFQAAYLKEAFSEHTFMNIEMNDSEFDRRFLVRGNKENEARAIIDPAIRSKIMNIRDFNAVIGFIEESCTVYVTNIAQHVDFHSLSKTKRNASKFKSIVDTLIDIVEKVETYTPSSSCLGGCHNT